MTPYYTDPHFTLHLGDCLDVMRELPAESVDAVVTDPPYGLEFMGKSWDRLTGPTGGAAIQDVALPGTGFKRLPNYRGSPNPTCQNCKGMLRGQDRPGFTRCRCDNPVFPNMVLKQSRLMQAWHEAWAREAFRLLKPGGHLLAFGGTRTYHRLTSAIEDAGFEIRDCLVWAYASGFPKSLDVSKAIDRAAGAEREVTGTHNDNGRKVPKHQTTHGEWEGLVDVPITAPATDAAHQWDGWGTALKPAWEPIVMARKPLRGTVAQNVLAYGTGALNIDGTRIGWQGDQPTQEEWNRAGSSGQPGANGFAGQFSAGMKQAYADGKIPVPAGRWPANVILTDPIFDGDVAGVVGGGMQDSGPAHITRRQERSGYEGGWSGDGSEALVGDGSGTKSRFFQIPRRGEGCCDCGDELITDEDKATGRCELCRWWDEKYGRWRPDTDTRFLLVPKAARSDREPLVRPDGHENGKRFSIHPTMKPTELMRHLVRLVTPPGGTCLDPFLGSGTTAIAANQEGFRCIGIEKEREYCEIAVARLAGQPLGLWR